MVNTWSVVAPLLVCGDFSVGHSCFFNNPGIKLSQQQDSRLEIDLLVADDLEWYFVCTNYLRPVIYYSWLNETVTQASGLSCV